MLGTRHVAALATVGALVLVGACQRSSKTTERAGPVAISDKDKAAIEAADGAFEAAVKAGNTDGVAAIYMEDATLLPPNMPPQKGRDAIRASWAGLLKDYAVDIDAGTDAIGGCGELAYHVGHFKMRGTPKAKGTRPFTDEGKFLEILKKQPDGSWKYVVDMYSSNLPPQH